MRVLVTNDDGVASPGLRTLAAGLAGAGHDVLVLAPFDDRSGTGAALDLRLGTPIRSAPIPGTDPLMIGLDGGPALAITLAQLGAFGARPDVVLCGVNAGANTGRGVLHSGTVGAALTAATMGLSALAISIASERPANWSTAASVGVTALDWLLAARRRTVLNVNVPDLPYARLAGIRYARLAAYGHRRLVLADQLPDSVTLGFQPQTLPLDPSTDVGALADGWVSVTKLTGVLGVDEDQALEQLPELRLPNHQLTSG